MNKKELITDMAKNTEGLTQATAELALNAFMDSVTKALQEEDKIMLVGFGSFEKRSRAARQGRNPKDPTEIINIPACNTVHFKLGKELKEAVNKTDK